MTKCSLRRRYLAGWWWWHQRVCWRWMVPVAWQHFLHVSGGERQGQGQLQLLSDRKRAGTSKGHAHTPGQRERGRERDASTVPLCIFGSVSAPKARPLILTSQMNSGLYHSWWLRRCWMALLLIRCHDRLKLWSQSQSESNLQQRHRPQSTLSNHRSLLLVGGSEWVLNLLPWDENFLPQGTFILNTSRRHQAQTDTDAEDTQRRCLRTWSLKINKNKVS